MEMRKLCGRLMQSVDVVISPVNPIVSYPADWASPTNDPARPFEHIAFTVPWNMSEQPASSINCGFSKSGMPIGLQIVGPRYEDLFVLKLSRAFETWGGGVRRWPEPPRGR
jgi:aspartyl-tRNA(Asn)/glutamyl-tRNA(Gln) amidotransferase subunit A